MKHISLCILVEWVLCTMQLCDKEQGIASVVWYSKDDNNNKMGHLKCSLYIPTETFIALLGKQDDVNQHHRFFKLKPHTTLHTSCRSQAWYTRHLTKIIMVAFIIFQIVSAACFGISASIRIMPMHLIWKAQMEFCFL